MRQAQIYEGLVNFPGSMHTKGAAPEWESAW